MVGATRARVVIDADKFDAAIFDMDGVITDTARLHESAWKRLFDGYLVEEDLADVDARPFLNDDYRRYVDGRSRVDGVQGFLASRGVHLAKGTHDDPPGLSTAWALANRKNVYFLETLKAVGVHAFPTSVTLVRRLLKAGVRTAIVTASANRAEVLAAAGISDLFEAHVDGLDAARLGLAGKPAPDTFSEAAYRLDVEPPRAVVFEDALAGVEAAHRGGFGLVIGVDRIGHPEALRSRGADVVVADLGEIEVRTSDRGGGAP